jgi:hypothetical protein
MDTTEILFAATIALIYPFFFNKLTDKIVETGGADKKAVEFNKHVILVLIGMMGVFSACFVQTHSTKLGLGLGGILTLMTAFMMYWSKYNENMKLVILGVALAIFVYLSARLYSIKNIDDLFSFELSNRST